MKIKTPAQRSLRIKLSHAPSANKSNRIHLDGKFRRFELPFNEAVPPNLDRRRILLADELRKSAIRSIEAVTRCAPSSMSIALDAARSMESIIEHALEAQCLPDDESETSFRGNGPHTLKDCLLALEACRRNHRAPAWWNGERGILDSVNHKLDILAGMLIRRSNEAEAWSSIGGAK